MWKSLFLIAGIAIVCGCTHDAADLNKLAKGLEQPWPGSNLVSMTMTVRELGGHPVLHCRLQNPYWKAIALDRSRLPWKTPIFFTGTVVTSTGHTFAIEATHLAYLSGPADPFSIGPAEVVEGDFEFEVSAEERAGGTSDASKRGYVAPMVIRSTDLRRNAAAGVI
jgi:hypothetical protein